MWRWTVCWATADSSRLPVLPSGIWRRLPRRPSPSWKRPGKAAPTAWPCWPAIGWRWLQGCPLNLADYLKQKIFAGSMGTTLEPREEDVRGFTAFLERYKAALQAERAAVEHF